MRMPRRLVTPGLVLALAAIAAAPAAALTALMTLGGSFSDATAVNSNKEVVGDAADSADHD